MINQQYCTIEEACDLLGCASEDIKIHIDANNLSVSVTNDMLMLLLDEVHALLENSDIPVEVLTDEYQNDDKLADLNVPSTISECEPEFTLSDEAPQRDRIVILGRTRSGKTVFITRMYEQLWNSRDNFFIKALSGATHKDFLRKANHLRNGNWFPSTGSSTYTDFEITDEERTRLLVSLDYSGELFTMAFTDGVKRKDADELINHVDRACAVILLLSPDVDHENDIDAIADDTIGMQLAVQHIRDSQDGDKIPIAIVVTKGDEFKQVLRDYGGLRKYLVKHYLPLIRVIGHFKPFVVAAVQCKTEVSKDGKKSYIPSFDLPPINLLKPLRWCLDKLNDSDDQTEWERRRDVFLKGEREQRAEQIAEKRRLHLSLSIIFGIAIVLSAAAIMAIIAFMAI